MNDKKQGFQSFPVDVLKYLDPLTHWGNPHPGYWFYPEYFDGFK